MLQKHKVLCINNVYQKSTNQIYHFNLQGATRSDDFPSQFECPSTGLKQQPGGFEGRTSEATVTFCEACFPRYLGLSPHMSI